MATKADRDEAIRKLQEMAPRLGKAINTVMALDQTATHEELVAKLDAMKPGSKVFGARDEYTKSRVRWTSGIWGDRLTSDEVVFRCGTGLADQ